MRTFESIQRDLIRALGLAVLALFLLPALTYWFAQHVNRATDAMVLATIETKADGDAGLSTEAKQQVLAFYRANPASTTCGNASPDLAQYREAACGDWSPTWQMHWAQKIAAGTIAGSALALLATVLLGLLAFRSRRAHYASLVMGWRLLAVVSALTVTVQSGFAVWLSFWVSAFFFNVYFFKIIAVVGFVAAVAVFHALTHIFKRVSEINEIEGELLSKQAAPALWARVRAISGMIGTGAPDQVIAGVDNNFFVTEVPLTVNGAEVTGRTLFVSLPLLRVLSLPEADAVLAHELAHLRGGDAASTAKLSPKLQQFDRYCAQMAQAGLSVIAYFVLNLFRFIFELALKRDSREREFKADRTAADTISGAALIQALIKVSAYGSYRQRVERDLFERNTQDDKALDIAAFVAQGVHQFADSIDFEQVMKVANMPHPFDSHPAITERMGNVGHQVSPRDYGAIVGTAVAHSWIDNIDGVAGIEGRLWSAYESRFKKEHELALAYRYMPSNDTERAVVLKYFPAQRFDLRGKRSLQVSIDGLTLPGDQDVLAWDCIAEMKYEDGYFGDVLRFERAAPGEFGVKKAKIKLPGIGKQRDQLKGVLGSYHQRHDIARQAA